MSLLLVAALALQANPNWITEEVGYIITDRERELYQSLETVEERERFVAAFWARRDPDKTTAENEFRDEHYRRLDYANEFLGRESFVPGWRTDRGRYYILLGAPRTIQRFYGQNDLKEAELWFYQAPDGRGLPAFFYLLFFKADEVGDYRLYHPVADGPSSLLRRVDGNPIETLEAIDPELAHASLSLDAGEPPDLVGGRAAIGTDALLARIAESPKRAIRTDYVDAWSRWGKHVVSAEYSFNWVPSRSLFALMTSADGTPIVHYSIEIDPENFGLETDETESRFHTTLDVNVEVVDERETTVHATSRATPIELTGAQVEAIRTAPVAYQDDFPLIPGRYTVRVYLQNRALENWTVAETELDVSPSPLTDVILCYDATEADDGVPEDDVRTFQLGGVRLEPATGNVFASGDTVVAFSRASNPPEGAVTRFELLDDAGTVLDVSTGGELGRLSTVGLAGGDYLVRARLVDTRETVIEERRVSFTVSPRAQIARPAFVYRRGFNTRVPGLLPLVRGDQLWQLGRFDEAASEYRLAVAAKNPDLPQARWKLATAYLRDGDGTSALPLLAPLESRYPNQFEVIAGLGLGYYLEADYARAVGYLERALEIRAPETSLLNALGDTHQRLGNHRAAKDYFERSLALDPDQESVRKRLTTEKP